MFKFIICLVSYGDVLLLRIVSLMAGLTNGLPMSPGYGGYQTTTLPSYYTNNIRNNRLLHHQGSRVYTRTCDAPSYYTDAPNYITKEPEYYTEAPKYYTIKAPEYYTTTYAAPAYYTEAPNYCNTEAPNYYTTTYAAPSYYTDAPKYYSS